MHWDPLIYPAVTSYWGQVSVQEQVKNNFSRANMSNNIPWLGCYPQIGDNQWWLLNVQEFIKNVTAIKDRLSRSAVFWGLCTKDCNRYWYRLIALFLQIPKISLIILVFPLKGAHTDFHCQHSYAKQKATLKRISQWQRNLHEQG